MPGVPRKPLRGLPLQSAITGVAVAGAFFFRQLLVVHYGIQLPAFVTFYPVIMVTALAFGAWAGVIATALSALLADLLIFPPVGSLLVERTGDAIALVIFSAMGVFMSAVAERYRINQKRLAALDRNRRFMPPMRAYARCRNIAAWPWKRPNWAHGSCVLTPASWCGTRYAGRDSGLRPVKM